MAGRFSVEAVFKAVDRVTAPVTRMQNRIGKFTRSVGKGFRKLDRNVDKFISGMKKGALVVVGALALSGAAMADVISTGAKFEQTLVSAAAKFPGEIRKGTKAFEQLELAARKTGATTEFTASQSAGALNFLAMAGFNAESSIAALPGIVDLATVAQLDLARASDIATDALGAFGLTTEDTEQLTKNLSRVTDTLATTANSANTDVSQLFDAMKKAGPIATQAGASIETVAALIGSMANAGTKAEKAGTAVANMFLNLTSPATKARKVLKRLGIEILNDKKQLRDIPAIIGDLNKATTKLTKAQRLSILESIFGREGLAGVATVVAKGEKGLRKYRKEIEAGTDSTGKLADVMRDTLQGRLNSLTSAIEGVKISIFSMTSGPLSDVVDKMTAWVRANESVIASGIAGFVNKLIENLPILVEAFTNIAKGVAAVIALSLALKGVAVVVGIINLLMAANPWVLGIMAAVGAVAFLLGAFDPVLDIVKSIGRGIASLFSGARTLGGIFGFGDDDEAAQGANGPQVISPQERTARSIEESRTTSNAEVTIKDDTGRAEVTRGKLGNGIHLLETGGA